MREGGDIVQPWTAAVCLVMWTLVTPVNLHGLMALSGQARAGYQVMGTILSVRHGLGSNSTWNGGTGWPCPDEEQPDRSKWVLISGLLLVGGQGSL